VWRSVPHASALKHATGEAVYCDDIPKFENELVLELVLSERANAVLRKVDATNSLKLDGVKGYISHEDLDPIRNKFGIVFKDEEIFASQHVMQCNYAFMRNSLTNS
jgi:xanthine dehydrogenase/oxidase